MLVSCIIDNWKESSWKAKARKNSIDETSSIMCYIQCGTCCSNLMTMLQYDKGHPIINNIYYNKKCASANNYSGSARGVVVYQYTRKKFAKIPKNTQNSSKYTQNYTQVYFIPEIQRKWYTEYPYLSCNIPYTRFKKPVYTVYPI